MALVSLPPADPLVGQTLSGRYRLDRLLGSGGAGAVYEASQLDLDRKVAIKVLRAELAADTLVLERFRREARLAASLSHPHIAQVLGFEEPKPPEPAFIALELVRGSSLLDLLRREPRFAPERAVLLMSQTLSALDAAHRAGIVHRDLKPGNLVVSSVPGLGESVKLLDFGIAHIKAGEAFQRLTRTGAVLGTPRYMAPEQISGGTIDPRTDVWAAGVVLYRMLAGVVPFDGSPDQVLVAILRDRVPPIAPSLGVSEALEHVVLRALQKKPDDRFPTARAMMDALLGAGFDATRPSMPPSFGGSATPSSPLERSRMPIAQPPLAMQAVVMPTPSPPRVSAAPMPPRTSPAPMQGAPRTSPLEDAPRISAPPRVSAPQGPTQDAPRMSFEPGRAQGSEPAWTGLAQTAQPGPSETVQPRDRALGNVVMGLAALVLVVGTLAVGGIGAFAFLREGAPSTTESVAVLGRSAALPGGAPRIGDLATYRAIADGLARAVDPSADALGFSIGGEIDPQGRIDFDRSPTVSASFLYRVASGCLNIAIVPGAPEAGQPSPCVGEPLPYAMPPLPRVVAQAWSACPALVATDRVTIMTVTSVGGEMRVNVTNASGHPTFTGLVEADGSITTDSNVTCVP